MGTGRVVHEAEVVSRVRRRHDSDDEDEAGDEDEDVSDRVRRADLEQRR